MNTITEYHVKPTIKPQLLAELVPQITKNNKPTNESQKKIPETR